MEFGRGYDLPDQLLLAAVESVGTTVVNHYSIKPYINN